MKKAYTLSEVLVVLLVLGIIAAFIIPAVMRTAPDRSALLYKKSFYSMQEATEKMINNQNMYPIGATGEAGQQINPTEGNFADFDKKKFCENLANTFNVLETASPKTPNCENVGADGAPNFYTTNGVAWYNFGGSDAFGESVVIKVSCAGTEYRIKVWKDGRVTTDSDWTKENTILKAPFKFRDI